MFTVASLFTQNDGDPAIGLTLTDIDVYLYRRAKATGIVSTVWNGVNPTEEIGGGLYGRAYTNDDTATYEYFAYAQYTGAAVLDTNYALQNAPTAVDIANAVWNEVQAGHVGAGTFGLYLDAQISGIGGAVGGGAIAHTITVTDGANPLDGAEVWISTDAAGVNVIAGTLTTDAFGQATFMLDAGNYYAWVQLAGYNFGNPTAFTVP